MQTSRRQGLGIWLLFYQIFGVIGFNKIPPATLVITALQVLIFLRIIPVPWHSPTDVCISVDSVWHRKHWLRLLYGAVEHGNDWHLYYNMISFIWKGISLERKLGSARFAYLISVFTLLCSATLVGLCQLASEYADDRYYYHCAVGFSSVLFALKVLTTHYWPHGSHHVFGMPFDIPVRYLVWTELLLIHILVPNSSLLGHLAGILVGLAYVHTPLGFILDSLWNVVQSALMDVPSQHNRFHSSNRVGSDSSRYRGFVPEGMTEEQQFEFARQESLRTYSNRPSRSAFDREVPFSRPSAPYPENYNIPSSYSNLPYPETDNILPNVPSQGPSLYPDLEAIRRQRLNRFN